MSILVLGGAGAMGATAVSDLASHTNLDVVVADLDGDAAREIADQADRPGVTARSIDLRDQDALRSACERVDVVANATLMEYVPYVTRIAAEAGADLVDLGAYLERTREQFNHSDRVETAGVTVVPGCGVAPGLTNVLARYGANQLDETTSVYLYSYLTHPFHSSHGIVFTRLDAVSEPTHVIRDGEFVEDESLGGEESVVFPEPYGEQDIHFAPHPEPFTFKETFDDLENAWFKVGYPEGEIESLRTLRELGLAAETELAVDGTHVRPRDVVAAAIAEQGFEMPESTVNAKIVVVEGNLEGHEHRRTYEFAHVKEGGMASEDITGAFLAIAAAYVHEQSLPTGIIPPEDALDPDFMVSQLIDRGFEFTEERHDVTDLEA